MLSFEIPGVPIAQHRPRFTTVNGYARTYSVKEDALYRQLIQKNFLAAVSNKSHIAFLKPAALMVGLKFCLPIPPSWSAKKRMEAINGALLPVTKPDIDNLEKAIFDALNKLAWEDDAQIVKVEKLKMYSSVPKVYVLIKEFTVC